MIFKNKILSPLLEIQSRFMGKVGWVKIEDYYPHKSCRRYGGIVPQHARIESILAAQSGEYEKRIKEFTSFMDQFLTIPISSSFAASAKEPVWNNGFFPAFDAISLFGFISTLKPRTYFEIGSGHSTRIAAKAKALNSPSTRIISLDPFPRAEIDELCDEVIRKPLEECDLSVFDELSDNDILFFDGSHRVLQNSDTEVFFFDILPRLKRNVYIHLHDIYWPFDYPDEWAQRMYSEQYVLGGLLLYAWESFEIILPNVYITWCTKLLDHFRELWEAPGLKGIGKEGVSFWFKKRVDY
ncbi:MAG: class I SAM-dependent methyltransferase [Pseudomonadota bacterium]|nr:class I SAM-dependent methyltransferase [Pseudomonadota bacterium]